VAKLYRIRLAVTHARPSGVSWGGISAGHNVYCRTVYVPAQEPFKRCLVIEDVLHELVHIVTGKRSVRVCEGYVLMPFEWKLAVWMARRIPNVDRGPFLRAVASYQAATEVSWRRNHVGDLMADFPLEIPTARRQRWWRAGLLRAQQLGLLDTRLCPTFRDADWSALPAAEAYEWCMEDDVTRNRGGRA
jgi:hypothetical protein